MIMIMVIIFSAFANDLQLLVGSECILQLDVFFSILFFQFLDFIKIVKNSLVFDTEFLIEIINDHIILVKRSDIKVLGFA